MSIRQAHLLQVRRVRAHALRSTRPAQHCLTLGSSVRFLKHIDRAWISRVDRFPCAGRHCRSALAAHAGFLLQNCRYQRAGARYPAGYLRASRRHRTSHRDCRPNWTTGRPGFDEFSQIPHSSGHLNSLSTTARGTGRQITLPGLRILAGSRAFFSTRMSPRSTSSL